MTSSIDELIDGLREHAGDLTIQYARAVPKDLLSEAAATLSRLKDALERAERFMRDMGVTGTIILASTLNAEADEARAALQPNEVSP